MFLRLLLIVLCGLSLSAQMQKHGDPQETMRAKEAALDALFAEDVRSRTQAVDDPTIAEYVEQLGRRLASGTAQSWSFAVIADNYGGSTHEPLSLPGGHIFVSLPLIASTESEAELAGLLAHALAHGMIGPLKVPGTNQGKIPLVFIGGMTENILLPGEFLNQYRSRELEADRIGARMMSDAGFSPVAVVEYLSRTQRDRNPNYSPMPPLNQRIAALEEAGAKPTPRTSSSDDGFTVIRERARQLTASPLVPKHESPTLLRKNDR